MVNKRKTTAISPETKEAADKLARATQRPGQTKEQTKLIAQGIEKGIAQYKKQQKLKAREMDKRNKKAATKQAQEQHTPSQQVVIKQARLPWVLLMSSWLGFAVYALFFCRAAIE